MHPPTYEHGGLAGVHVDVLGLPLGDDEAEELLHAEGRLVPPPRQDLRLHGGPSACCRQIRVYKEYRDVTRKLKSFQILQKYFPIILLDFIIVSGVKEHQIILEVEWYVIYFSPVRIFCSIKLFYLAAQERMMLLTRR